MTRTERSLALSLLLVALGCGERSGGLGPGADGAAAGRDGGAADGGAAILQVPETGNVTAPGLSADVQVVRDEWGIPHIYGQTFADVAYAEGYVMAQDRLVQMELGRFLAEGTLARFAGVISPALLDQDIRMRIHHLKATAQASLEALEASNDPNDKIIVEGLGRFAAGVNAYVAELNAGSQRLPAELLFVYDPSGTTPWTEVDSVALAHLQAFQLSFDADSEIALSALDAAEAAKLGNSTDPDLIARKGIAKDLQILAPVDPTYSIPGGWGFSSIAAPPGSGGASHPADAADLALFSAARGAVRGIGHDALVAPSIGSNNWVIAPSRSANGHAMVANDTHLSLGNPATFYLVHLVVRDPAHPLDAMGVQFPGIPGIVLGMNEHVAWGGTVSYVDVSDIYKEVVVPCDGGGPSACVAWKGGKVPLVPRTEMFEIGRFGHVERTVPITFYDVPHHGPILPRIRADHTIEALGSSELSIRWTGHEPAHLVRGVLGIVTAKTAAEGVASLERDFKYGGQNWVFGDDGGNIAWTQAVRAPRRPAGSPPPWKVLPGDGSADWTGDLPLRYVPHATNPAQGYVVTANADPIGTTDDGDPWNEPVVDGAPLYLGGFYDPGTREGRATKRVLAKEKLTLDDMSAIQADAVSEYGQHLAPTLLDAGDALLAELATPGSHPELAPLIASAQANTKATLARAVAAVRGWSFDTPAAMDEEQPTAAQLTDSLAAAVVASWTSRFAGAALGDELSLLDAPYGGEYVLKLLIRMCNHPELLATPIATATGDPVLFDRLGTPAVESKRFIAAEALLAALRDLVSRLGADPAGWRWGKLHTLALEFPAPMDALRIPQKDDPKYGAGFPRHGGNGTVDVGYHGISTDDFTYAAGPAIRFVCELDPGGPRARNVLPGGETFDPSSPHYADQMELWRKNKAFDLAFSEADVVQSALKEKAARGLGRVRFHR